MTPVCEGDALKKIWGPAIVIPIVVIAVVVGLIVGIGEFLLLLGNTGAIFGALALMVIVAGVAAILAQRAERSKQ